MMQKWSTGFSVDRVEVGPAAAPYFIADIAANHDGSFERAVELINLASEAGANAAKFQHFKAQTIVSDAGFRGLGNKLAHQANWRKSVFEVYEDASLELEWTARLKSACDAAGITFLTSPYAFDLVDAVDSYLPAFKIGSGDITWLEIVRYIASKNKPVFLAAGASNADDVSAAVSTVLAENPNLALMQCNTNYTGSPDNFKYIQLNVLRTFAAMYPGMVLGLSDHTPGHATVLGAIALGASVIEKHFTDDTTRIGPDHKFSMTPAAWREMVDRSLELHLALGGGVKRVEENEVQSVIVQRRALWLNRDIAAGELLRREDIDVLRPCPDGCISAAALGSVVDRPLLVGRSKGACLRLGDV